MLEVQLTFTRLTDNRDSSFLHGNTAKKLTDEQKQWLKRQDSINATNLRNLTCNWHYLLDTCTARSTIYDQYRKTPHGRSNGSVSGQGMISNLRSHNKISCLHNTIFLPKTIYYM